MKKKYILLCMYVRLKTSKKAKYPTLQIVKGVRVGKTVKQQTIAHLGVIKGKKDLQKLLKLAENLIQRVEKEGIEFDPLVHKTLLIHKATVYDGFGIVVDRLMQLTGLSKIIQNIPGRHRFNLEEIIKLIIVQRLDLPSSKLRTYERQNDHGFQDVDLENVYRAMDVIEPFVADIQKWAFETVCAFSALPLDCFFFDVTTLYFESVEQDEIRDFGFSKDQKHHCVQIVLALVVDSQGMPVAYEIFKGNLSETKTLLPVLESLRSRFSIKNVTIVCDRAMASKPNVLALQAAGFHYVIATKLRSISKKLKINDLSEYSPLPNQENVPEDEKVLFRTLKHPQYDDALLIATYSPLRAEKDRKDRERLLEKLAKKLTSSSDEASVKKVMSNGGYKKFTNVKEGSQIVLNQEAIEADAAWDGFHGIAVADSANLSVGAALARYRDLWHVEEAFRIAKCTLKTRPIFHWKPHRIRAHVLLCFVTLFLERFLELRLRQVGKSLTPDRIRYALSQVHSIFFEDKETNQEGKMESALSEDAENIFTVLGLPIERFTSMKTVCCA
jgi:hypothetical protein